MLSIFTSLIRIRVFVILVKNQEAARSLDTFILLLGLLISCVYKGCLRLTHRAMNLNMI